MKQILLKQPIHLKIFFSFAGILLLSIFATMFFGNSMMEKLYTDSKTNDLKAAYQDITAALLEQDCDLSMNTSLLNTFYEVERDNVTILLFTMEQGQQARIYYFSRENQLLDDARRGTPFAIENKQSQHKDQRNEAAPFPYNPEQWIHDAVDLGVFQTATLPLLVTNANQQHPGASMLDYYGKLTHENENIYIFLRTPQEPITLAAGLAVKYNLYLSLLAFALMAIMSYFVARHITRPIEQISQATQRISQMNFSQQCQIHTRDELQILSENINAMALKLQDYIYQLELNQQLLEKDLQRETKTNQLRKEFIANVSHDFKTPLTLIRAYTETLRNQQLDPEEQQKYYDIILGESNRMSHLVTQLLQLSKLESGIVQLEQSYFPIEELLREILHQNQLLLQQKQLQIDWDCEDNDHIVQGDYLRIEQALINLLENAIKYTPEWGQILLQVHTRPDGICRIAITNTCAPLTDEQLENLFISFYKTDESRHLDQQSFGLGLAIVKATIDLHGQTCTAQNTPDGLQIAFTLPLLQDAEDDWELDE